MKEEGREPAKEKAERKGIQSVEIAYRLLTVLQQESQALPLKEIAARSGMTASATNNYLVSLVRTGLASAEDKPGFYKLGPSAMSLGMSAIRQVDGFELVRRELGALRDATKMGAAITTWTADGALSLFKLDGKYQGAFELRTGLVPIVTTAAGRVFIGCLPAQATHALIEQEWTETMEKGASIEKFQAELHRELERKKYATVLRSDMSGYASIAAPIRDWSGEVKFTISLIGSRSVLQTDRNSEHVKALLASAARATTLLGGSP